MVALKKGGGKASVLALEKNCTEIFLDISLLCKLMMYIVSK